MQNKIIFKASLVSCLLFVFVSLNSCRKSFVGKSEPCTISFADSSASHPKHAIYSAIVEKYKRKGLPGMAILIEDEYGVWMGSAGKADIKENIDFRPCTVSKVASITKMMFGAAVMQLREQGKVNLNDKASLWLDKNIVKNVKNLDKVTIRDLLQHSTGIYDIIADGDFYLAVLNNPNKKWKGSELIKYAYDKPITFEYVENATKGSYSNTNTLLLSMCIDKITGRPHNEWMHELVIDKLGMSNTYYSTHDDLPSQTAQGYYDLYNNGTIVNVSNLITGSGNGFGGVYSNVLDLHKFMRALFIDKTLVTQQSLDIMTSFIEDDEKGNLGVGLLQQYKNVDPLNMGVGHSGRDLGYSADAHYFPTKKNRIFINIVNYGTNGNTPLRDVFYAMREEFAKELMRN